MYNVHASPTGKFSEMLERLKQAISKSVEDLAVLNSSNAPPPTRTATIEDGNPVNKNNILDSKRLMVDFNNTAGLSPVMTKLDSLMSMFNPYLLQEEGSSNSLNRISNNNNSNDTSEVLTDSNTQDEQLLQAIVGNLKQVNEPHSAASHQGAVSAVMNARELVERIGNRLPEDKCKAFLDKLESLVMETEPYDQYSTRQPASPFSAAINDNESAGTGGQMSASAGETSSAVIQDMVTDAFNSLKGFMTIKTSVNNLPTDNSTNSGAKSLTEALAALDSARNQFDDSMSSSSGSASETRVHSRRPSDALDPSLLLLNIQPAQPLSLPAIKEQQQQDTHNR